QWLVFASYTFPGNAQSALLHLGLASAPGEALSYDQDTARLRLVKASGGAVLELTNATHIANKTTTWPKFAPFIQDNGNLVFFTFSAKFNYGFVVTDGQTPQLWMSAIDLGKAQAELGAGDPSSPPFWLPFQDPTQKNHTGIWTQEVACTDK